MKKIGCLFLLIFSLFACHAEDLQDHEIVICNHSLETLDWITDLIGCAEQSIEISAPFLGGLVGCKVLGALEERLGQKADLQVYLLVHPILLEEKEHKIIKRLKSAYRGNFHFMTTAEVPTIFPRVGSVNNHMKLVVVDETYYVAGGTNLDDEMCAEGTYTPPGRALLDGNAGGRDTDVVGKGALAHELRLQFHKLYAVWEHYNKHKQMIKNTESFAERNHYWDLHDGLRAQCVRFDGSEYRVVPDAIKMVFSGSMDSPNKISKEYQRLIDGAQKSLVIGNLYFHPIPDLYNALLKAVNREIDLTLITNGTYNEISPVNNKLFVWASRINYVPLFYGRTFSFWEVFKAAGAAVKNVKIFEYYVPKILYHKKVMVVDERYLVIGSYNFGMRSNYGDYELILVMDSPELCRQEMQIFKRDLEFSKEVEPVIARSWYFDPWISYLGGTQKQFHGFF